MALLELRGLTRTFGGRAAVDAIDLDVNDGETLVLLGPSGCGKSTLLRLIAGLEQPDGGSIRLDGAAITAMPVHRRPVNMMFQSYALFPHLDVFDNIAFGLRREGLPAAETAARVRDAMAMLEIAELARRRPDQLSGGQQQRVALARALVKRPRLLLLDEPLGALDKRLRQHAQAELRRLNRQTGVAFVIVTHDNDEAMVLADRIAVMRDGRLRQVGTPREVYERPRDRFVATLLADINLIEDGAALHGLRPEQIEILDGAAARPADAAPGQVTALDYAGGNSKVTVALADGRTLRALCANGPQARPLQPGDPVWLRWNAAALVPLARD